MTVRDALNSALDEEMSADPKVFLMGEEVRIASNFWMEFFFLFSLVSFFDFLFLRVLCLREVQVGEYQGAYKVRLSCQWYKFEVFHICCYPSLS